MVSIIENNVILDNSYAASVSTNDASKIRSSLDIRDRSSLTSILNKIPQGLKVRDKFKSKLREISSNIASPVPNNNFLKSLTNVSCDTNAPFRNELNKMRPMRTKTLVSDDNYSDHSSDLDFATSHREYNKMHKVIINS